jgi:subfamily B ATP-binding cassette protein MsbA
MSKLNRQIAGASAPRELIESHSKLIGHARLYVRAISYFRQDLLLIVWWILLIGVSTAAGLLSAWPMAILLDSVLSTPTRHDMIHRLMLAPLPSGRVGQIAGLAVIGLVLKIFQDLLSAAQTIISNQVNYNGLLRVRCDLYRKLQALSVSYHKSQPQGDAIYRLSSDTFGCQTILGVIVSTFVAVATLLVMTGVLAARSLPLTLLAFSIVPPLAVANIFFGQRLKRRSLECKERDSQFMTVVQRSMSCIGLVQAFGREAEEFGQFHGTVRETIRAWWGLNREQILYNIIVGTLFGLGGAAIFGYGGFLVYRGALSAGDLMVFTAYLGMLWGPLCALTGFASNVQGGVAGAQRVFEVLDRDAVICDSPHAVHLPRQPRMLELNEVTFSYEGSQGKPVLDRLSLRIQPGEMVAFVGSSGAGKSTLLNLLPRFYDPTAGSVRLDGVDARDIRLADLRRHVALVLQDSVILPTSIAENIAYGRPGATREQIKAAAELAGAADFIQRLPLGYDTLITEGGQNLSGGQRQRISIARALMTEAPFVILDEPTSALDPIHEQLITQTLSALKGKRTIILVSHRLSTVRDCDQIFVIEGGGIVERGTHAQLLSNGGHYCRMASHQLAAPALATAA